MLGGGLKFNIFAFDKTKRAFDSVKNNINGVQKKFKGLKGSVGAMGPAIAGAFSGAAIKAIVDNVEQIDKFAKRVNISTEALSELRFVGEQSGVQFSQMSMGLQRMTRRIGEASKGMGEGKDALRELGLDAVQLSKIPVDEQFMAITRALSGTADESDRLRLAFKLFDSEGTALLQTMTDGEEGMLKLRARARELGVVTAEQAKRVTGLNDRWNEFVTKSATNGRKLLSALAPVLMKILDLVDGVASAFTTLTSSIMNGVAKMSIRLQQLFGLISDRTAEAAIDGLRESWRGVATETEKAKNAASNYVNFLPNANAVPLLGGMRAFEHDAGNTMSDISRVTGDGIGNMINDLDNWKSTFKSTVSEISRVWLSSEFRKAFEGMNTSGKGFSVGDLFSPSGGSGGLSTVLNGLGKNITDFFGGFFADGGNFGAGKPIIVGERGPEMILPRHSGTVIPNEAMQGGSVNVVINVSTPDANSFRNSKNQIAAEYGSAMQRAIARNK